MQLSTSRKATQEPSQDRARNSEEQACYKGQEEIEAVMLIVVSGTGSVVVGKKVFAGENFSRISQFYTLCIRIRRFVRF